MAGTQPEPPRSIATVERELRAAQLDYRPTMDGITALSVKREQLRNELNELKDVAGECYITGCRKHAGPDSTLCDGHRL